MLEANRRDEPDSFKYNGHSLKAEARSAATSLLKCLSDMAAEKTQTKVSGVRLLVVLDEADSLVSEHPVDSIAGRNCLHAFLRAFDDLATLRSLFAVVMSTNSSMSKLSPTKDQHPSQRVSHGLGNSLLAPWTELPFDICSGTKDVVSSGLYLQDLYTLECLSKFGRPL